MIRRLDGGLATALQVRGLAPFEPVEPWLDAHPDRVLDAHRAFVAAGATDVLTATFRCLPGVAREWLRWREIAIDLASAARPERVWLALGPGGDPAPVARDARVSGVVLETFVDPIELLTAVRRVRTVWSGPLVGCLVPTADGTVPGGIGPVAHALRDAGVDGVGFNCAAADGVGRAVDGVPDGVAVWAKPNGPIADPDVWRGLAARCTWLGGCCGALPADIRRLADLTG